MNRRQKKKLYKKLCDEYNMPYSSFTKNRENKTMCKGETKMVSQKLLLLKDILKIYSIVSRPNNKIVEDIDSHSLYPVHIHNMIMVGTYDIIQTAKDGQNAN